MNEPIKSVSVASGTPAEMSFGGWSRAARTHVELSVVVVIPLYDGATYIKRAIESVFAQTIQPAEIVVVDDGSRDNGPEIVMGLPQADRITLLRKSNGGQASARNLGMKSSKSVLIAFLDQRRSLVSTPPRASYRGL